MVCHALPFQIHQDSDSVDWVIHNGYQGHHWKKRVSAEKDQKKNSRSQAACNTWHVQSINCCLFYTNSPPQHKTPVFKHPKQPLSAQNVLLSKPKPAWFLENGPYTQQNIKQMNSLTQVSSTLFTVHCSPTQLLSFLLCVHPPIKKRKTGSASLRGAGVFVW